MTMMMEFRIFDVQERFRTLKMYKQKVDDEKSDEAFILDRKWRELVQEAKLKDHMLQDVKKHFAKVTQSEVAEF